MMLRLVTASGPGWAHPFHTCGAELAGLDELEPMVDR